MRTSLWKITWSSPWWFLHVPGSHKVSHVNLPKGTAMSQEATTFRFFFSLNTCHYTSCNTKVKKKGGGIGSQNRVNKCPFHLFFGGTDFIMFIEHLKVASESPSYLVNVHIYHSQLKALVRIKCVWSWWRVSIAHLLTAISHCDDKRINTWAEWMIHTFPTFYRFHW